MNMDGLTPCNQKNTAGSVLSLHRLKGAVYFATVTRRAKKKRSLLAPAGSLIKRLSDTNVRLRRRFIRYGLWTLGLLFLYSLLSGTYGIPRIIRLHIEKQALIESNRQRSAELVDLARIRGLLQQDQSYIERVARERYHMVWPNETIYRYRGR
jgi:cell division protein FtsB